MGNSKKINEAIEEIEKEYENDSTIVKLKVLNEINRELSYLNENMEKVIESFLDLRQTIATKTM